MGKAQLTPEGWRCEKKSEHLYRPKWVDFQAPAIHLLTLVTTKRRRLFGEIQTNGTMRLSPLGQQIAEEITNIPSYKDASNIEIYRYVVMPDHVHILLRIHERLPKHLGQYIRWFKRQCNACCQLLGAIPPSNPRDCSLLAATPASKQETLFAAEYHSRTLSGRGQLEHMARYIQENPQRAALKRANPDLFKIHQQYTIAGVLCTVLGNMFLTEQPMRAMVQCSRKLTQAEIDARRDECLSEAANGVIHVSAAISEGEKQICRALREAGFPLIILLTEGFPKPDSPHYKYYKPQGVYFEACAAGRLLLVEPSAELYERPEIEAKVYTKTGIHDLPHTSQRYRFLALNALAEKIAEESSAE